MEPCEKLFGPKTQARKAARDQRVLVSLDEAGTVQMSSSGERGVEEAGGHEMNDVSLLASHGPSRSLSVYNPSIDPADIYILQHAYRMARVVGTKTSGFDKTLALGLILKFAWHYGESIGHPSLHAAVVAYCKATFLELNASEFEIEEAYLRTHSALYHRLRHPEQIDEGDLFCASLLASRAADLWWLREREAEVNARGLISIMCHLVSMSGNNPRKYPLFALWSAAREIILLRSPWAGLAKLRWELLNDPELSMLIGHSSAMDISRLISILGLNDLSNESLRVFNNLIKVLNHNQVLLLLKHPSF